MTLHFAYSVAARRGVERDQAGAPTESKDATLKSLSLRSPQEWPQTRIRIVLHRTSGLPGRPSRWTRRIVRFPKPSLSCRSKPGGRSCPATQCSSEMDNGQGPRDPSSVHTFERRLASTGGSTGRQRVPRARAAPGSRCPHAISHYGSRLLARQRHCRLFQGSRSGVTRVSLAQEHRGNGPTGLFAMSFLSARAVRPRPLALEPGACARWPKRASGP